MHNHEHTASHASHSHGVERSASRKRLSWALVLIAGYMVAEIIGGLLSNSLALLADAGHMLADAAALALSLFALWIGQRPATPRHSFGYYRAEILAAVVNAATLLAIAVYIFVEAWQRLGAPPEVQGELMSIIAFGGLVVNLATLWILSAARSESLNVRGAWLHVLTDTLGSVAAVAGGLLVWAFGWDWADPVVSVLIALLVVHSGYTLLQEAVAVLMEGTPGRINVDEVRTLLLGVPGVQEVHDLHIWTITSGLESLSAHLVVAEGISHVEVLQTAQTILEEKFGIEHVTLQLEPVGFEERKCMF